jgi:hypothetical protein
MRDATAALNAKHTFDTHDDLSAIGTTRVSRDIAACGTADSRGLATGDLRLDPVRERGDERGKPNTDAPFLRWSTV